MKVKDLNNGDWHNSLLRQSPLWERDVAGLKTLDLSVFLRQHLGTPLHMTARSQVDGLISHCWNAVTSGALPKLPEICFFSPPVERLTYDELRTWLARVSPVRRAAILFGLEMRLSVSATIDLTWKALGNMELTKLAHDLACQFPRHFRLPYVFWEIGVDHAAMPLIGLDASVDQVTEGRGWAVLCELYDNLIPMDQDADHADFLRAVGITLPQLEPAQPTLH